MAQTKLPDTSARLHHHFLWHRHHNTEEVWILKRLEVGKTGDESTIFFFFCIEKAVIKKIIQTLNQLKCLTEAGRQKTDCSVTRR